MKKILKVISITAVVLVLCAGLGWGGWLWYDNNVDRSGWVESDGVTMYKDFHGKPVTGWQDIHGLRYYFDENFALYTGWLEQDGVCYYLNSEGFLHIGWLELDGEHFFLNSDGSLATGWLGIGTDTYYFGNRGVMQTGWMELEDTRHYINEDGTLATGWLEQDSGVLYLDARGTPLTGWQDIGEDTYYLDEEGYLLTGWQEMNGQTYLFGETGPMVTGWAETEKGRCYFLEHGPMATDWQIIDSESYFFGADGAMYTGWLEQGEYRYYFGNDGIMVDSPTEIDGETYYFSPRGICVLLVNPWHSLDAEYTVDLVEVEDGWKVDKACLEALEKMLADCRAAGLEPAFSSAYRDEDAQRTVWKEYVQRYMAQGYDEETANSMTAKYVAQPGTSEHHTGLAVDIVGLDYYGKSQPGATTAVHQWLREHCWEYGFILRYEADKQSITGFAPEAWHFRYVGTLVSMDMKDSGLCLEEYLGAVTPP